LLNKGLIYNLNYKPNDWIRTLALQAETANFSLPKQTKNIFGRKLPQILIPYIKATHNAQTTTN